MNHTCVVDYMLEIKHVVYIELNGIVQEPKFKKKIEMRFFLQYIVLTAGFCRSSYPL